MCNNLCVFCCRFLQTECDQECGVHLQVWARVRDGHVHAAQVPGVPAEEVPGGGNAARVRGAREPVRHQAQGEEGAEREGQAGRHHHLLHQARCHPRHHEVRAPPAGSHQSSEYPHIAVFNPTNLTTAYKLHNLT